MLTDPRTRRFTPYKRMRSNQGTRPSTPVQEPRRPLNPEKRKGIPNTEKGQWRPTVSVTQKVQKLLYGASLRLYKTQLRRAGAQYRKLKSAFVEATEKQTLSKDLEWVYHPNIAPRSTLVKLEVDGVCENELSWWSQPLDLTVGLVEENATVFEQYSDGVNTIIDMFGQIKISEKVGQEQGVRSTATDTKDTTQVDNPPTSAVQSKGSDHTAPLNTRAAKLFSHYVQSGSLVRRRATMRVQHANLKEVTTLLRSGRNMARLKLPFPPTKIVKSSQSTSAVAPTVTKISKQSSTTGVSVTASSSCSTVVGGMTRPAQQVSAVGRSSNTASPQSSTFVGDIIRPLRQSSTAVPVIGNTAQRDALTPAKRGLPQVVHNFDGLSPIAHSGDADADTTVLAIIDDHIPKSKRSKLLRSAPSDRSLRRVENLNQTSRLPRPVAPRANETTQSNALSQSKRNIPQTAMDFGGLSPIAANADVNADSTVIAIIDDHKSQSRSSRPLRYTPFARTKSKSRDQRTRRRVDVPLPNFDTVEECQSSVTSKRSKGKEPVRLRDISNLTSRSSNVAEINPFIVRSQGFKRNADEAGPSSTRNKRARAEYGAAR
ncbi:hypothetical protein BKA69DRAFT_1125523 [Paraphysoderma sedebokerense]|nr:hypothetical protein BKA69DRAFT_1125523 [Paraphysoderma sedebokerense]